jgi:SAM-dependent methyltransferase
VFLNKAGFEVVGVDLSANSIQHAKQFENQNLHFDVADLRNFKTNQLFDYAFNLFTSFAYFKSDQENQQVLNSFNTCIKPNGILLLDFFNAEKIKKTPSYSEVKTIDGISFCINKVIDNEKVVKRIEFNAEGKEYYYQEVVQLLTLSNFETLFNQTGFTILNVFGNYNLEPYQAETSDRLIFIAQKN